MAEVLASTIVTPDYTSGVGPAVVRLVAGENPLFEERVATLKVHSRGRVKTVSLVQKSRSQVIAIPSFDYLILRYRWEDEDGSSLETASRFVDTGVSSIDGVFVGKDYMRPNVRRNAGDALIYFKDNSKPREECNLIDFKKVLSDPRINPNENDIRLEVYANWLGGRNSGAARLVMTAFKGGRMIEVDNGYQNEGGKVVFNEESYINIPASGKSNYQNIENLYTRAIILTYDKQSKDCVTIIG